jgi:hypothetical protein
VAFAVSLANGDVGGEAEAEAFAEKRGEGKVVVAGVSRGFSI